MKDLLLEAGRLMLAALVSFLLTEGVLTQFFGFIGTELSVETKGLIILGIITILKSVDRFLHESWIARKGLARF